jgi:hypothetical protein
MFAAWLLASLAIGAGGTWLARRYALRHALLDAPGERRAHTQPTPRGGGIGIVVALLLAGAWLLREGRRSVGLRRDAGRLRAGRVRRVGRRSSAALSVDAPGGAGHRGGVAGLRDVPAEP